LSFRDEWGRRIRRNSLWFVAGEIGALILVPLFIWVPCDLWLGWAAGCPPSTLVVVAVSTSAYLLVAGLLLWIVRHRAGEEKRGGHG
jgi:hypothetical protein